MRLRADAAALWTFVLLTMTGPSGDWVLDYGRYEARAACEAEAERARVHRDYDEPVECQKMTVEQFVQVVLVTEALARSKLGLDE